MDFSKVLSIFLSSVVSTLPMLLIKDLADRKIDKAEFQEMAKALLGAVAHALNDVYEQKTGERPIDSIDVHL